MDTERKSLQLVSWLKTLNIRQKPINEGSAQLNSERNSATSLWSMYATTENSWGKKKIYLWCPKRTTYCSNDEQIINWGKNGAKK